MNKRLKIKALILISLFLVAVFSIYFASKEDSNGRLTVVFLNVGQGDAIFIESPSGNQMLIDGGPGGNILRELGGVMPFYDKSIDVVLATHADQDHIGGIPDVLKKYKVSLFMESGVPGPSSSYEEMEKIVSEKEKGGDSSKTGNQIKKILARRGMVVDLGGGAILQILFPDRDPSGMETNTSSIVAKLVYEQSEFLLTGDSPSSVEEYLVSLECQRCPLTLQSDVLKAGHHGSKTSSSEEFVSAVSPEYAVISAGKDNRYGHPAPEVLKTFKNKNIKILSTIENGRILFESDGENLTLK